MRSRNLALSALTIAGLASAGWAAPTLEVVLPSGSDCFAVGERFDVTVEMHSLDAFEAAGFQAFIEFDPAELEFVEGTYTGDPFGLQPDPFISAVDGVIALGAGINQFGPNPQSPTSADAILATLTFRANAEVCSALVGFEPGANSGLTDDLGDPPAGGVTLVDAPPVTIDSTAPVFADAPGSLDVQVECEQPYDPSVAGAPAVSDNCDASPVVTSSDLAEVRGCGQEVTISRTWTATDACGNTSEFVQVIEIVDTTPPAFDQAPGALDVTVDCTDPTDPGATGAPTATDVCDPDPSLSVSDDLSGLDGCAGTGAIVRTWTATDVCGNESTYVQTITVVDATPPAFLNAPGSMDAAVSCSQEIPPPSAVGLAATDDCGTVSIVFAGETQSGLGCPSLPLLVVRTYRAADSCGNVAEFTQTITVMDDVAPTFDSAPGALDVTVDCDDATDLEATGMPEASDNCAAAPTLAFSDTSVPGECRSDMVITRTWTATDSCGNSSTYVQTITVADQTPPTVLSAPADVTVECSDDVPAPPDPLADAFEITDNCGDWTVSFEGSSFAGLGCPGNALVITRTFRVTDECGNAIDHVQTITVIDTTPPVVSGVPADLTVACGSIPPPAAVTTTDNCDPDAELVFEETTSAGACANEMTITRTWTSSDKCNNETVAVQVITVVDDVPPVIDQKPGALDMTVECTGATDPVTMGTPTATDACDPSPGLDFTDDLSGLSGCNGTGAIVRTWIATDACGNASAPYVQTITIVDQTAPVFDQAPGALDVAVECTGSTDPADTGTPTVTDACDAAPALASSDDAGGLSGCSGTGTIVRTWTATDACGNVATYTQVITVQDTIAPEITIPAGGTVACDEPTDLGTATATDACSATVAIDSTDAVAPGACAGETVITRTWTATDECGNVSSGDQVILVIDTAAPQITDAAGALDATVSCGASIDPADVGTPAATDVCDPSPALDFTDDLSALTGCSGTGTITRTWIATDACGNASASYVQTITVTDDVAPALVVPADATVECGDPTDPAALGAATATDDCDPAPAVSSSDAVAAGACPGESTIVRTWTATDACGNTVSVDQTITVLDTTPPAITCPADVVVNADAPLCTAVVDPGEATATDGCGEAVVTAERSDDAGLALSDPFPVGTTTITWTATDECGLESTCTQTVVVEPFNELVVTVELSPTIATQPLIIPDVVTRCITFELYTCPGLTADVVSAAIDFAIAPPTLNPPNPPIPTPTVGTATLLVPCGRDYTCISARDTLHSLRRVDADDFGLSPIAGTQYVADFRNRADDNPAGEPAGDNDWLVGGNFNDDFMEDNVIDIFDFGVFSGEFLSSYLVDGSQAGDTDCETLFPHADASGDGAVFSEDFTFIGINWLERGDEVCCALPQAAGVAAAAPAGVTSVSVDELYKRGLAHLAVGDVTRDGWLDEADMAAFLSGVWPEPLDDHRMFAPADGPAWHDADNWGGAVPTRDTDVTITGTAVVDGPGARARLVSVLAGAAIEIRAGDLTAESVLVAAGGSIEIRAGRLAAAELTVEAGAVLVLDDAAAVLDVATLHLHDGARLVWLGGVIEIDGGAMSVAASDLLVGVSDVVTTLRVLRGAAVRVDGATYLGWKAGSLGELDVRGSGSLFESGPLSVGYAGRGELAVAEGGLLVSDRAVLGETATGRGRAVVSGPDATWLVVDDLRVGDAGTGDLALEGGRVVARELALGLAGALHGFGAVEAHVANEGLLRPAGDLRVLGDVRLRDRGVLEIGLGRAGIDRLLVDGHVELGGLLRVVSRDGALPRPGEVLEIVVADRLGGTWDALELPALPAGQSWETRERDGVVELEIVTKQVIERRRADTIRSRR